MKFDVDDLTSGAALSRASSASFGLSFSFTGFTLPPDDIADSTPFSDDDIRKLCTTYYLGGGTTLLFTHYIFDLCQRNIYMCHTTQL